MSTTSTIFRLKMCDDNYVPPTDENLSTTLKIKFVLVILKDLLYNFRLLLPPCGCLGPFCITLQLWTEFGKWNQFSKLENLYDEYFWQAYVWNKKCLTILYVWTSFTPTKKVFKELSFSTSYFHYFRLLESACGVSNLNYDGSIGKVSI